MERLRRPSCTEVPAAPTIGGAFERQVTAFDAQRARRNAAGEQRPPRQPGLDQLGGGQLRRMRPGRRGQRDAGRTQCRDRKELQRQRIDDEFARLAHRLEAVHGAQSVHVAGNQVPAEALGQGQRLFQVDFAGRVQADGLAQALARDVDREGAGGLGDHGHAGTIDGDRVAQHDIGQRQAAGVDCQAHAGVRVATQRRQGLYAANRSDDSSKHASN